MEVRYLKKVINTEQIWQSIQMEVNKEKGRQKRLIMDLEKSKLRGNFNLYETVENSKISLEKMEERKS